MGGVAEVQDLGNAGGTGNEVWMEDINLNFDWGPVPLDSIDFLFGEYGGNLNLGVNGVHRNFENLIDIHGTTIGGVLVSVTDFTGGVTDGNRNRANIDN